MDSGINLAFSTSFADTWRTRTDAYPQHSGFAMITARERPKQEPEKSARTIGEDVYAMNELKRSCLRVGSKQIWRIQGKTCFASKVVTMNHNMAGTNRGPKRRGNLICTRWFLRPVVVAGPCSQVR